MYNVHMNLRFVWDEVKNRENIKKHGVSFKEAASIFSGFPLEIFYDPDHSRNEDRYIAVGISRRGRVLLVIHCENVQGTVIRLISAQRATKREQKNFFGGNL